MAEAGLSTAVCVDPEENEEKQPLVGPAGSPTNDENAKKGKKSGGNTEYHEAAYYCTVWKLKRLMKKDRAKSVETELDSEVVLKQNDYKETCLDSLVRSRASQEKKMEFLNALFSIGKSDEKRVEYMKRIQLKLLTNEDRWNFTVMEKAAFRGQLLLLERMLWYYSYSSSRTVVPDGTEPDSGSVSSPSPKTSLGKTLLHSAADGNQIEVAKFLLKRWGKDLNAQDDRGFTPLHKAARLKHKEMTSFLLEERNILLNVFDKSGKTPIFYIVSVPGTEQCLTKKLDQTFVRTDKYTVLFDPGSVFTPRHSPKREEETSVLAQLTELPDEIVERFLLHSAVQTFLKLKLQRIRVFHYANLLILFLQLLLFTALTMKAGVVRITFWETSTNFTKIGDADPPLACITCILAGLECLFYLMLFICYAAGYSKKGRDSEPHTGPETQVTVVTASTSTLRKLMFLCVCYLCLHVMMMILIWFEFSAYNTCIAFYLLALLTSFFLDHQSLSVGVKYISMLTAVTSTFLKMVWTFWPLFLGFILVFSVLFEQPLLKIPTGIMTFFVMIVGEFNLEAFFGGSSKYVDYAAPIFFTVFVILLSIVFMNLWIGLALSDTVKLERFGTLQQTKSIITKIVEMEHIASILHSWNSEMVQGNKGLGIWFPEQINILHGSSGKIKLSLRDPTKTELTSLSGEQTGSFCWRRFFAFLAFKLGMVFAKTSLKEQFPLPRQQQLSLEEVLTRRERLEGDERQGSESDESSSNAWTGLVANAVLNHLQRNVKRGTDKQKTIDSAREFFTPKDVLKAKELMWNRLFPSEDMPQKFEETADQTKATNLSDLWDAFKRCVKEEITTPVFVVVSPDQVPR